MGIEDCLIQQTLTTTRLLIFKSNVEINNKLKMISNAFNSSLIIITPKETYTALGTPR